VKLKIDLNDIGINYCGSLCSSNFFTNVFPQIHHSHKEDKWIDNSNVSLIFEDFIDRGAYGALALCRRLTHGDSGKIVDELVFAKIPARPFLTRDCLFWEACIQMIVRKTLTKAGFKNGAPRVRDIFELRDGTIGYTMDIIIGAKSFDVKLRDSDKNTFLQLIIEGIFQVASMISILQKELGFNHRDLRAANLLCREIEKNTPTKIIVWDEETEVNWQPSESFSNEKRSERKHDIEVHSNMEFTLIDFGFTSFSKYQDCDGFRLNGHVYSPIDPCPKPGRDMFMFLAFLLAEFGNKMNSELRKYFKKWLHTSCGLELPLRIAKPGRGIYQFLRKYGLRGDKWIYFISGNVHLSQIRPTNAIKVVANLQGL